MSSDDYWQRVDEYWHWRYQDIDAIDEQERSRRRSDQTRDLIKSGNAQVAAALHGFDVRTGTDAWHNLLDERSNTLTQIRQCEALSFEDRTELHDRLIDINPTSSGAAAELERLVKWVRDGMDSFEASVWLIASSIDSLAALVRSMD